MGTDQRSDERARDEHAEMKRERERGGVWEKMRHLNPVGASACRRQPSAQRRSENGVGEERTGMARATRRNTDGPVKGESYSPIRILSTGHRLPLGVHHDASGCPRRSPHHAFTWSWPFRYASRFSVSSAFARVLR